MSHSDKQTIANKIKATFHGVKVLVWTEQPDATYKLGLDTYHHVDTIRVRNVVSQQQPSFYIYVNIPCVDAKEETKRGPVKKRR